MVVVVTPFSIGQLRAEELRILRAETEQLRAQNADMKRKAQIELESLQVCFVL